MEKAGVAVLAGTSFGSNGEGFIRLSYANSQANIKKALERIAAAFYVHFGRRESFISARCCSARETILCHIRAAEIASRNRSHRP